MPPTTMPVPFTFLDDTSEVGNLACRLFNLPRIRHSLYLGLQGSGSGTASLLTVLVMWPGNHQRIYLINILGLGARAFNTPGPAGHTLAKILEDSDMIKIFFDVRNDAAVLHARYGISVQGITEVQFMENASRPPDVPKLHLDSLARCVERDSGLSSGVITAWKNKKSLHRASEALARRPLPLEASDYAIMDVLCLPTLTRNYSRHLSGFWGRKAAVETMRRVQDAQQPSYRPHGGDRETGPWQGLEQEARQFWCDDELVGHFERLTWGNGGQPDG